MVYKIIETNKGDYIDSNNKRYRILEATNVATPQGKNVGWTTYESIEDAANKNNLIYDPINTNSEIRAIKKDINELKKSNKELVESNQMLTDCLLEVSEIVYQ